MEKLFEVKTKYTLEEHIKYNFAIARKSKEVYGIVLLLALILVYGIVFHSTYAVIFTILFPIAFVGSIYFSAKKNYMSNKAAQDAEITMEFYQDCIVQKTEVGSYKVAYDKIDKIIETKTHFYVMIARNQGLLIPKDKLTSEMETTIRNIKITK